MWLPPFENFLNVLFSPLRSLNREVHISKLGSCFPLGHLCRRSAEFFCSKSSYRAPPIRQGLANHCSFCRAVRPTEKNLFCPFFSISPPHDPDDSGNLLDKSIPLNGPTRPLITSQPGCLKRSDTLLNPALSPPCPLCDLRPALPARIEFNP